MGEDWGSEEGERLTEGPCQCRDCRSRETETVELGIRRRVQKDREKQMSMRSLETDRPVHRCQGRGDRVWIEDL